MHTAPATVARAHKALIRPEMGQNGARKPAEHLNKGYATGVVYDDTGKAVIYACDRLRSRYVR